MQITSTILNIPPYISTTWSQVAALRCEKETLIVSLKSGEIVEVPGLDSVAIKAIFDVHATYLENEIANREKFPFTFSLPINPADANGLTSFASMQHTPEDANLPDIPPDILEKIAILTKSIGLDPNAIVNPESETCNCTYCQIARAVLKASGVEPPEEYIADEDLAFRDWQIEQTDQKLYCVTSPLDPNEQYRVFLGEPLGCTCGQKNCEHIKAVLQS